MTQFNFLSLNHSISFNIETLNAVTRSPTETKNISLLQTQRKFVEEIKNRGNYLLQNIKVIDKLFSSVEETIKYLNSIDYLPSTLPKNIDITFINTHKISFLNSKEERDLEKKTGGAATTFSSNNPLISLSSSLLNTRHNKNNFYNFCYSAFKDIKNSNNEKISESQVQHMLIETAFLHELGHVFSTLNHEDKSYFLMDRPEPILNSIKRNYEEGFAESFCIHVLNKKYPNQNFLKWMQAGRLEASRQIEEFNEIEYYDISRVYDLVLSKNPIGIEPVLSHIKHCAQENLKQVLNKKISDWPTFLEFLASELKITTSLNVDDVIKKVKEDFSATWSENTDTAVLKNKIFSLQNRVYKGNKTKILN